MFDNDLPNGVSVETDDIDEENTEFRVITFTYSKNEHFAIKTDLAYSWTLRTLNDSEFNVELTYEPDFFQIIKNLKNEELKSASKRRFNNALQKIYVEQLKTDGNYYCEELKTAQDRIHNLNVDLNEAREQVENLQNECESAYSRKEATLIKQRSTLQELKKLKDEFNRMKFLKEFYTSETKIAKDKRIFAEKNLKEITKERDELKEERDELKEERDELKEERDELKKELNGSRIKYDKIKKRYNELEDECDSLDAEVEEVRRINDELTFEKERAWESEFEELKSRNNELEEKLELMEEQQAEYDEELDELDELKCNNEQLKEKLELMEEQQAWESEFEELKSRNNELEEQQAEYDEELDELDELKCNNEQLKEKLELMEEQQAEYEETINNQVSSIKSLDTISKDVDIYKDLAKKYKANLELKDRDIENLEDIITEYKNELNKPIKYREEVKSLKADNSYLKTELVRLKQEYKKLNNKSNNFKWSSESDVKNLKKEIAYLKGKRINKKKIEIDICDFHKRGYDMLDWYKHGSGNYTNEFIQFQKETEFLFNDVLNYFKSTLLNKNKDTQA